MSHKAIFVQPGGGYERVIVGTSEAAARGRRDHRAAARQLVELPRLRGGERHVGTQRAAHSHRPMAPVKWWRWVRA